MEMYKRILLILAVTGAGFAFPWALMTLLVAFAESMVSDLAVVAGHWLYHMPLIAGGTFGTLSFAWSVFCMFWYMPTNDWFGYKKGDRLIWLRSDN